VAVATRSTRSRNTRRRGGDEEHEKQEHAELWRLVFLLLVLLVATATAALLLLLPLAILQHPLVDPPELHPHAQLPCRSAPLTLTLTLTLVGILAESSPNPPSPPNPRRILGLAYVKYAEFSHCEALIECIEALNDYSRGAGKSESRHAI
jgi:hypothetical protein